MFKSLNPPTVGGMWPDQKKRTQVMRRTLITRILAAHIKFKSFKIRPKENISRITQNGSIFSHFTVEPGSI